MTCRKNLHNFFRYKINSKKLFLFFIIIGFFGAFLLLFNVFSTNNELNAQGSPDAIAIRVIPNQESVSPLRWYREQNFSGSPQLLYVDGYEAVRDGRTVYVNAANVIDTDSDGTPDEYYANIYLISYNQNAENETVDIFGRILKNWKFNTNLGSPQLNGYCFNKKSDCSGTVGCWTFDDSYTDSGVDYIADSSGNDIDGTLNGAVGFTMGNNGSVGDFSGGYVDLGNHSSLNFTGNFSVEASFISPSFGGMSGIFSKNDGGGPGATQYTLGHNASPGLYGLISRGTSYITVPASTPYYTLTPSTFYHAVFVVDTDFIRLYVNGSEVGAGTARTMDPQVPPSGALGWSAKIGRATNTNFTGQIDEVKVYNRALTADEIANKYKNTLSRCTADTDCNQGEFCGSFKAKIARDTSRLADMVDIKTVLEYYATSTGHYPRIEAGTYLPNKTITAWPSWNNTLGQELNTTLPSDPINKLGPCTSSASSYNSDTCWDEINHSFADPTDGNPATEIDNGQFNLPDYSYAYVYSTEDNGKTYKICANMETGTNFSNLSIFACKGNVLSNNPPIIRSVNLPDGITGQPYSGFIEAYDPDGDLLTITADLSSSVPWASSTLWNTNIMNMKEVHSYQAGAVGTYSLSFTVNDNIPLSPDVTQNYTITINSAPTCVDLDFDGYGDTGAFGQARGCIFDGLDCNDTDGSINPGAEETCGNIIDENCDSIRAPNPCPTGCGDGFCDVAGGECSDPDSLCAGECNISICCGNGITDSPAGEACDDGDSIDNNGCTNSCDKTYCGDGIKQVPNGDLVSEQCDDGNLVNGDGCSGNTGGGVPGPGDCQIEGTGCTPTTPLCDGICPYNCLYADDPDCDCTDDGLGIHDPILNPNACCGVMCTSLEDPNCGQDCGNGICEPDLLPVPETPLNCSVDCGIPWNPCGNGVCQHNLTPVPEDFTSCPGDCPVSCTAPSNSLVSWWPGVDPGSGSTIVTDFKGPNSGNLVNCPPAGCYTSLINIVDDAFVFDSAADQHVLIPPDTSLDLQNAFTIEGWVNISSGGGDQVILIRDGFNANDIYHPYKLSITSNDEFYFSIGDDNSPLYSVTSNAIVTVGDWYHIAAVYNGNSLVLYINSYFDNVTTNIPAVTLNYTGKPIIIGTQMIGGGSANSFNGYIDEISIYSSALSGLQIRDIYNSSVFGKCKVLCEFNPTFTFPCILL